MGLQERAQLEGDAVEVLEMQYAELQAAAETHEMDQAELQAAFEAHELQLAELMEAEEAQEYQQAELAAAAAAQEQLHLRLRSEEEAAQSRMEAKLADLRYKLEEELREASLERQRQKEKDTLHQSEWKALQEEVAAARSEAAQARLESSAARPTADAAKDYQASRKLARVQTAAFGVLEQEKAEEDELALTVDLARPAAEPNPSRIRACTADGAWLEVPAPKPQPVPWPGQDSTGQSSAWSRKRPEPPPLEADTFNAAASSWGTTVDSNASAVTMLPSSPSMGDRLLAEAARTQFFCRCATFSFCRRHISG